MEHTHHATVSVCPGQDRSMGKPGESDREKIAANTNQSITVRNPGLLYYTLPKYFHMVFYPCNQSCMALF